MDSFESVDSSRRAIVLGPCIPPLGDAPVRSLAVSKRDTGLGWLERELRAHGHSSRDLRVGVDAGVYFWKEMNIPPQVAIGDWDSLAEISGGSRNPKSLESYHEFLRDSQVLTLPQKKDRSDLHYALRVLMDLGIDQFLCFGFSGGRPDHHLANLIEFGNFAAESKIKKITSIGPEAGYYWVNSNTPLVIDRPGDISVFAWNGKAEGVSLEGMEYTLKNAKLEPSSQGLSNRVLSKGQISVRRGLLLVIVPFHGPFHGPRRSGA
jgi:thiamine pyrophosphokinase